jgi:hypothetical protein
MNRKTSMHTLASRPSVLAVLLYTPALTSPAMSGDEAIAWRDVANSLDALSRSLDCSDLRLSCADAQVIRYIRDGDIAVVAVTSPAIEHAKSLLRTMRAVIRNERALFRHHREGDAVVSATRRAVAA